MNSLRVALNAHLLSPMPGYRAAGIHTYIRELLRHLPQVAPDWSFTALVGAGHRATHFDGVTLRRSAWDTVSPWRRIVWEQALQPWQLGGYELYHALAFVGPMLSRVPMIVTVYDLSFLHYPERLSRARRAYLSALTGRSCQRARRVIAISESTKRDLVALLGIPAAKIDVTPLGYDATRFKPLADEVIAAFKRRQGLPERFWLFVGTLEPRKNLPTLLEAYAALPRSERLPLILAGGRGWDTDAIDATIARHGLSGDVHLPGFLPTEAIPLWYNSAETFVYPSVFEGFGLPILEAMACGTPIITTDASSLPEVAGDAGECLPPHDVAAWTDALHRAYRDAAWREQARHNGLNQARQFNWQTTARRTLHSYRRVVGLKADAQGRDEP